MENSRVQKYKDYRNSMIKDDSPVLETNPIENNNDSPSRNTTSTLPMDEVIQNLNKEEFDAKPIDNGKKKQTILIIALISGLVLLIIAIIIVGIILWR